MDVKRTDRLNELFRETIAEVLIKKIKDPRVQGLTITGASVSPDLRSAKVYFTQHGGEQELAKALGSLAKAEPHIRSEVSKLVKLKYMPRFVFEVDQAIEAGMRIDALIKQIHEGTNDHESDE